MTIRSQNIKGGKIESRTDFTLQPSSQNTCRINFIKVHVSVCTWMSTYVKCDVFIIKSNLPSDGVGSTLTTVPIFPLLKVRIMVAVMFYLSSTAQCRDAQ